MLNAPFWQVAALSAVCRRLLEMARQPLPPRERAVLETLMLKQGKTVSKQAIASSLFAVTETTALDAIEIYVSRLRRKLEPSDAALVTLRGLGYLLKRRSA